jgi:[protein-PII] uridylyltransferase
MKTIERLRLLTLMTWADISAVHPGAMSQWRAEQLWRLFQATAREFTRELVDDRLEDDIGGELGEFLQGLPTRYQWTHSRAEAEAHLELAKLSRDKGSGIFVERREGVWKAVVVTADRPFLFATLAGTLASFGLNILHAEAFANRRGLVVDTFTFSDPMRSLELNPAEADRLRQTMRKAAKGEMRAEDLLKRRPANPAPSRRAEVVPSVDADDESSSTSTVYAVAAQDRPGLLHALASAISRAGCNIEVVLVDTQAHRAFDVFHVTRSGRKLTGFERETLRRALLDACRS